MESNRSVAKAIVPPTEAARKEILKVFRGKDVRGRNTVFVNIWNGEVQGFAYYRSDKGEYLTSEPKDCYEFHQNKPNAFASYADVDLQTEEQMGLARDAIVEELKFLRSGEIGREMLEYESKQEFQASQEAMKDRLAELEGN